jgi:cbb3-type cytochrome oxidase maturation protein
MDILFLLIPLSVVLVFVIGAVFWLALRGGQFDDLEKPGLDIILDDDKPSAAGERHRSEDATRRDQP